MYSLEVPSTPYRLGLDFTSTPYYGLYSVFQQLRGRVVVGPHGAGLTRHWHLRVHSIIDVGPRRTKSHNLRPTTHLHHIARWLEGRIYKTFRFQRSPKRLRRSSRREMR